MNTALTALKHHKNQKLQSQITLQKDRANSLVNEQKQIQSLKKDITKLEKEISSQDILSKMQELELQRNNLQKQVKAQQ